jgi:ABC-2 type transport system permease protein
MMFASIKSEIRKILTIRSTYIILLIALGLLTLFAFYVPGWQTSPQALKDPTFQQNQVFNAVATLSLLTTIVAILSVTHEYRYNTIMHTLTANRSRTQVFLSKFIVLGLFALLAAGVFGFLSPAFTELATGIRGHELGTQTLGIWNVAWRALFGGFAYLMYGFIIAMIIRVQVGALVSFLLMFAMVEPLLGLVLKENMVYLPFQSLSVMMGVSGSGQADIISVTRAALVVSIYLGVGLLVSWVLFLRRDAN